MAIMMLITMVVLLVAGFPMMITLLGSALLGLFLYFPDINMQQLVQQIIGGVKPASLVAVPMFMFAADVITRGHSANRLLDLMMSFFGHLRGGLAVSATAACGLFGAVSGSTQATVVAIGGPMRAKMLKAGYDDKFTIALAVNAADLAYLIPPSIGMIIYGVVSGTSVSQLFIAGIGPGLLVMLLFSAYSVWYAAKRGIPTEPKATWAERWKAIKRATWPAGFPAIIVGGIYGGIFSPTEAAAVCAIYAVILEVVVFRSIRLRELYDIALSTGVVTSVVFVLVGAGAAFSWLLSYAQVPQEIIGSLGLDRLGPIGLLYAISAAFFIGCMFVDSIVVMLVLIPIFMPLVNAAGLNPVLVGTVITMQVAIGAATPPFGCDIFTAVAVFRRPYVDCIKGSPPFFLMLAAVSIAMIHIPQITLFLVDLAFTK